MPDLMGGYKQHRPRPPLFAGFVHLEKERQLGVSGPQKACSQYQWWDFEKRAGDAAIACAIDTEQYRKLSQDPTYRMVEVYQAN